MSSSRREAKTRTEQKVMFGNSAGEVLVPKSENPNEGMRHISNSPPSHFHTCFSFFLRFLVKLFSFFLWLIISVCTTVLFNPDPVGAPREHVAEARERQAQS